MKRKVISNKNKPAIAPTLPIVVGWLALDHWHAPTWVYGAASVVGLFLIAGFLYGACTEEQVDIFGNK